MTVTLEEFQVATPGSSASGSLPIATTLVSSDLVVVVASRSVATFGTLTLGGATPATYADYTNNQTRVRIASKTGMTGSQTLSYTTPAASSNNRIALYVVRGLTNSSITSDSASTWTTGTTGANTDETPTAVSVGSGQMVIALGSATAGTLTFPSNPSPSTGWAADNVDASGVGLMNMYHQIFTSPQSAQVSIKTTSATTIAALMLVVGDAVSVPPLTSTFIGWGNPIF